MLGAVVLAAGAATRYGQDKLMVPLANGQPLGSAIVNTLLPHVDRLVVILGADQGARLAMYKALQVQTLINPASAAGMGHSLAAGVAALPACDGYLIALADMPWVRDATVQTLVKAWRTHLGECIVRPRWREKPGHPVIFDHSLRSDLLGLHGDRGARQVLERYAAWVRYCDVEDEGILRDVDRPDDLVDFATETGDHVPLG